MFKSYGHIEASWKSSGVALVEAEHPEVKWVCTVKVDGSNFQVGVDESGEVSFGSRNQELTWESDFCGFQRVMEKGEVPAKAKRLKELLGAREVVIYGELCGGLYRHADVPKVPEAVRVQGRIDYSPDNEWVVFDVLADGKFISYWKMKELCDEVGLDYVRCVFEGTLSECLAQSPEYLDTTGHDLWGLPLIEGNVGEGYVIKPLEDLRARSGARLIYKSKNPKFKERIRKTKSEQQPGLNELESKWVGLLEEFITESRVWSAFSKLVKPGFGDVVKEVLADAEAELRAEHGEELEKVEREVDPKDFSRDKMRKAVSKYAAAVIKPVWVKKLAESPEL